VGSRGHNSDSLTEAKLLYENRPSQWRSQDFHVLVWGVLAGRSVQLCLRLFALHETGIVSIVDRTAPRGFS